MNGLILSGFDDYFFRYPVIIVITKQKTVAQAKNL